MTKKVDMDPYSKLLLCTALGLHCAKLTRLTHLPSFRQVVHMYYEGCQKNKKLHCRWQNMLVLLLRLVLSTLHFFAKIEDMNLEDLGSQFTSNFH